MSSKKKKTITKRLSTSFSTTDEVTCEVNRAVARMAIFGMATPAIAKHLSLTKSQVQTRIKTYKLTGVRGHFRAGETMESQALIKFALTQTVQERKRTIRTMDQNRVTVLAELREARKNAKQAVTPAINNGNIIDGVVFKKEAIA